MKRLFSTLLSITFILFTFLAIDVDKSAVWTSLAAFAEETSPAPSDPPVTSGITAENITLEYTQIPYNGGICRPSVTVKLGEVTLKAGADYTIRYSEDCVNIGEKTVCVTGKGDYTGTVDVPYTITPLYCSDNTDVVVEVEDCRYNGLPQYPNVTVKCGVNVIPASNYTVTLSDNVEVGTHAKCELQFRDNCAGKRTVYFNILKRKGEDFEIDLVAKAGQTVSIDLTKLKPAGAILGNPSFPEMDFLPDNLPRVAFNVLKFTLSPTLVRSTIVAIPITNIANCEDYWLEFYIQPVEQEIPILTLKPITKEYDGKPVGISALENSGSYAFINGNVLEGQWSFTSAKQLPTLPCEKEIFVVKFAPNDPQYSCVYGMAQVSVTRMNVEKFNVTASDAKLKLGELLDVTAVGIPEDFDGTVTISCDNEGDDFDILSEDETEDGKVFVLDFPYEDARYLLKVTLGGSAFYAPKTIELEVTVGNPSVEQPEDVPTTEQELASLIAKAEAGAVVKANKMTTLSSELLKAALAKKLTIEVKADDAITYVIEPAKMKNISALNLTTTAAVIPQILLDKTGDTVICSFTSFAKSEGGVSVKAAAETNLPIACFYLYNTSGELEHITSTLISGKTVKFELPCSGKFVITTSQISHIYRDLNNDCRITNRDIMAAIRLIVAIKGTPSAEQLQSLDFNGDGRLTNRDIMALLNYVINQ